MPTHSDTRVIVVDDHDVVRDGLKQIVESEPDMRVVAEAADAVQMIQSIGDLGPDVVLMDISIPGSSGIALTTTLRHDYPAVRIIGVSRHYEPSVIDAMLQAGAAGYVLKQNASSQLPAAIRAVASGMTYLDPALDQQARTERHKREDSWRPDDAAEALSTAEEDVLRLIAFSYTHDQIAARLGITLDETMQLKATAMQKARLASRIQIVAYSRSRGWLSKRSYRQTANGRDDPTA
jgi:DNA-binding NarL/FixJ family response regulator